MKIVLSDATYLRDSIGVISELVNEASFKVTKNGLELVAMDPANVAMVIFKLLPSCFSEFEATEESVAINLTNLKQVLKRSTAADILSLETVENTLQIGIKGKSQKSFSLPIIDIEEKEHKIPNLSFPVSVEIDSSALNEAVDDSAIVGESVAFIAAPGKFVVSAEGDLSKASVDITDAKVTSETKANIKSKYSIEYLKKMLAGAKIATTATVQFNQDYPLRLDYLLKDKVSISFILAPRVEND